MIWATLLYFQGFTRPSAWPKGPLGVPWSLPWRFLGPGAGSRGSPGGVQGAPGNPTKLHVVLSGRGVLWSFVGRPCGVPRDLDGSPFDPSKWVDLFAGVPWASPGLSPGASWVPVRGPGGRQGGSRGPRGGSVGPLGVLSGARGGPPRYLWRDDGMHRHILPLLSLSLPQAFSTLSLPGTLLSLLDYHNYQVSPVVWGVDALPRLAKFHTLL